MLALCGSSRRRLVVSAIVVTSLLGAAVLPRLQHGYPRRAAPTAAAIASTPYIGLGRVRSAKLLNPAVTWTQQEQFCAHARRFEQSTPVAVGPSTARRRLRESGDRRHTAHTRVAVYPVELVADTQDDTAAVAEGAAHGPRGEREPLGASRASRPCFSPACAYIGRPLRLVRARCGTLTSPHPSPNVTRWAAHDRYVLQRARRGGALTSPTVLP